MIGLCLKCGEEFERINRRKKICNNCLKVNIKKYQKKYYALNSKYLPKKMLIESKQGHRIILIADDVSSEII